MRCRSLVAISLALFTTANAAPPSEKPVRVEIAADLDNPATTFEGWGTALAWFAHVTGGWPDAERERLADLFFGDEGLRFTIARYNIGGGRAPDDENYLRIGADVPGFWRMPAGARGKDWWKPDNPAMWNWSADANQRWWLGAIKRRVDKPIFEAFSNSPPWFMTVSGRVSGNIDRNSDNLRPGFEGEFADYLVRVVAELEKREDIHFRTLSPVNEPGTDYWHAANTQEGSHWDPISQARMIDASAEALQARGMDTVVAAPDETSSQLFLSDWAAYPARTRARIGQLNVHSYGTVHQTAVRDIAHSNGIRLWMSESDMTYGHGGESASSMETPLAFSEHLVLDLKRLEPSAWVFWQSVETFSAINGKSGTNWGLVKADLRAAPDADHRITVTKKYWTLAQFSRFIRPGYRLLRVGDLDTVGAVSPDGGELVFVHVNPGPVPRDLEFPAGWSVARIATDATHDLSCSRSAEAAPHSVSTYVLARDPVRLPCN